MHIARWKARPEEDAEGGRPESAADLIVLRPPADGGGLVPLSEYAPELALLASTVGDLSAREAEALAANAEREQWVYERMAREQKRGTLPEPTTINYAMLRD